MSTNESTRSEFGPEPTGDGTDPGCRVARYLRESPDGALTYACSFRRDVVRLEHRLKVYVEEIGLETVYQPATLRHFASLLGSIVSEFYASVKDSYRALARRQAFSGVVEEVATHLGTVWENTSAILHCTDLDEDGCSGALDAAANFAATYPNRFRGCSERIRKDINDSVSSDPELDRRLALEDGHDACDGQCLGHPSLSKRPADEGQPDGSPSQTVEE